jgi:ClpP class serine protease
MKKQNSVLRLTERIYSSPQLITKEAFSAIEVYLNARNEGILLYDDYEDESAKKAEPFYNKKTGIGWLDVKGTLTNKPVNTMCGEVGTSYAKLTEQAEEMLEAGIHTIVMNVSSGGGEAYGCFIAANNVRQMADAAGAKIYGYVDGMAASAAYAWLSIADEIYSHPDAETGSIGVLVSLLDQSKYMEKEGLKRVFITAGKEKVPFESDGSFKQEFLDNLQYKVDAMYENFVSHVAQHTGMSVDAIKGTEAKTFMSKDALALGLIDGIKTEKEFQEYVVSQHKGKK